MNSKDNIEEYIKKTDRLEMAIFGFEGNNGINNKVKQHDLFIEQLKPQLQELTRSSKSLDEIKKNTYKIIIVLVTTALIAIGGKFIQIRNGSETNQTVNEIRATQQQEIKDHK